MLSIEENESLTKIDRGTPMGDYIRRFWMPFLQTSDIQEADGEQVEITLMGESLLAFRNTDGEVGLIQRNCPHRWASLFYGRNEENGIRCTYHGWKYDTQGNCVDMPTEAEDSNFHDKVKIVSYPVVEKGGTLWTYMGPPEFAQEFPDFEFFRVPENYQYVSWNRQENNFAQAIEGGIDSAHSNFLHSSLDAYWKTEAWLEQGKRSGNLRDIYHGRDQHPKFFAEDTDYGVATGARRETGEDDYYWRYNLFLLPFYAMPPGGPKQKFFHAFVPLDNHTTARWSFVWTIDRPIPRADRALWDHGYGIHSEVYPGPEHRPVRNQANHYLVDRHMQKTINFTGISVLADEDYSVQEGMGVVTPRQNEHLGTTDVGIIRSRRRLLKEANDLKDGIEPYAAANGSVFHLRAGDILLPRDANWLADQKTKDVMTADW
jgi:phenylpropionate dioxygenase-like ring-hydroxylating dioxygenase large terminal subunit